VKDHAERCIAGHQHRRFSAIDDPVLQCVDRSADGAAIKN
jgi:hypothetical protein